MRRLLLLRHAKTETDAPSGRDFDRRLDARGQSDAEQIGHWLAAQKQQPGRVLVSPAVRARQTWDIVVATLAGRPDVVEVTSLYNAAPNDLMNAIRAKGGDNAALMIVAHNPGLHEVAIAMTADGDARARRALDDNLPTSGLAVLDFDVESWNDIGFRRAHLADLISPKIMRERADSAE